MLQTFGVISYNDEKGSYRLRALNDGRYYESDLKLADDGKGATGGFTLRAINTASMLRINAPGEWRKQAENNICS